MTAVLDASVALKWQFDDEEATRAATVLLEDFIEGRIELITPTLFPYEIISAIHVAINRQRIREADGYRAINYITSLGIELRNFGDLIEPTFRTARQYGLSPYDCAYIALAERENCDFITGDKKLFKVIKNHIPWIKWIGDY
jgi:predicted nucleic acid-binding protein